MNNTKVGRMPSGIPDDIMRDLNYTAAIKFVADDIANNCQNGNGGCELAERLVAADSPIRFEEIDAHIPESAEYTSEEVLGLFCSVATFKEDYKNNNAGELDAATQKVDEARNMKEFNEAMDLFMAVYNEVGERAQMNYNRWMDACYA